MTDDMLMHRIRAHRSAPDVYDPPTFEDMADRIEALTAERDALAEKLRRAMNVLGGVRGAIKTGRNEPLMIWADQIDIFIASITGDTP